MNSKLKILFILPTKENTYDFPYARRQIALMTKNLNIESKVFYLESRTSIKYLIKASKRVRNIIHEFKPDICHAHYGSVNGLFAALVCKVPLIITFHGSDLNETPSDGRMSDFFSRLFSNIATLRSRHIIIVSEKMKKGLWWKKGKAHVIPIGTDINEFFPIPKRIAQKKLSEQFSFSYPTIVFNANNPQIKRVDIAEMAVNLLRKVYPKTTLLKMEGNVSPDLVPIVLNASDILLLCSDREGSPTIIKEAMACNLPIIATDVGDVKERIANVNEAILVEQSAEAIFEGINYLLKKDGIKKNGREELIRQELDEHSLQEKIYNIYLS